MVSKVHRVQNDVALHDKSVGLRWFALVYIRLRWFILGYVALHCLTRQSLRA
jgi:hypothetical protein